MRFSTLAFTALFVTACSGGGTPVAPKGSSAPAATTTGGGPVSLTIDGKAATFGFTPQPPITDAKFIKLWSIGNKRTPGQLVANEAYTNLSLTTAGKDIGDASLTAADIKEVALDVTYSVDATVAGGWGLTIEDPAAVADAKFAFSNSGGKLHVHVEGVGKVKDVNKDKVAASPALVFDVTYLPVAK